jgi:peptide/nickel transport system permease protein
VPAYIIALTLLLFSLKVPIFPQGGYMPIGQGPVRWFEHMLLPWTTAVLSQSAFYTRLTRGSLLDTLGEDYIRTARAKGLTERRVVYRHALRPAVAPVITQLGVDFGGALVTDIVFGLQGIGQLSVRSMSDGDLPVIMAVVLLAAFFVVLANTVVDIVYAILDPRVQRS